MTVADILPPVAHVSPGTGGPLSPLPRRAVSMGRNLGGIESVEGGMPTPPGASPRSSSTGLAPPGPTAARTTRAVGAATLQRIRRSTMTTIPRRTMATPERRVTLPAMEGWEFSAVRATDPKAR